MVTDLRKAYATRNGILRRTQNTSNTVKIQMFLYHLARWQ